MSAIRKILLTNDDGLSSPGLITLARELVRTGRYELRIVAPEKEQSGVGHCITLHSPLYAEPAPLDGDLAGVPACKVAGTPADCVKLAITNLFPSFQPDLALSGINRGPNVGINVVYSGTVAGALEACINGIPALALSLALPPDGLWHFTQAAEWALPLVDSVLQHGLPPWTILNVNFPNRPRKEVLGYRLTKHGRSGFREYYTEEGTGSPRRKFLLDGEMQVRDDSDEYDELAVRAGWVSVTPLGLCYEDRDALRHVKDWHVLKGPLPT